MPALPQYHKTINFGTGPDAEKFIAVAEKEALKRKLVTAKGEANFSALVKLAIMELVKR